MSKQIAMVLKRKLEDLAVYGELDAETRRNALKEELQYYILNFIYHHPAYSNWIMYGGSALRIIHGLDRMSVDLDFEVSHAVTDKFLEELKKEIEGHFLNTYGVSIDFFRTKIKNKRGLTAKFRVGGLIAGHASEWVDVTIDLNYFIAPKTVVLEHRPTKNKHQFSFVIVTYNMSALMASKIAAIFLREQRGIDKLTYDYKGRDIYDLLWYMGKKAIPDFDYLNIKLKEKGKEIPDIKTLFNRLTIDILNYEKMDDLLKRDVSHLFENPFQFDNWFKHWRESYLRLLDEYQIRTVTNLRKININVDFGTDNFSIIFSYDTAEGVVVRITYVVVWEWIKYEKYLGIAINDDIIRLTVIGSHVELSDQIKQFVTLFWQKNEAYFKKTNMSMLGDNIVTKVIRTTAVKLNPKEQIVLNKPSLLSCELDDLLK